MFGVPFELFMRHTKNFAPLFNGCCARLWIYLRSNAHVSLSLSYLTRLVKFFDETKTNKNWDLLSFFIISWDWSNELIEDLEQNLRNVYRSITILKLHNNSDKGEVDKKKFTVQLREDPGKFISCSFWFAVPQALLSAIFTMIRSWTNISRFISS